MRDVRIDGITKIQGGEFTDLIIDGIVECTGDLLAESIKIDGKFKITGSIRTQDFHCDGIAEFNGNIQAKRMDIDGCVAIQGDAKIESEEILCDGCIRIDGQISADHFQADGVIRAREIVGDRIVIHSRPSRFTRFFLRRGGKIDLIEATTIELEGVCATTVNGSNVTIGPDCHIDRLDCNGTLCIHPSATVQSITGEYTRI